MINSYLFQPVFWPLFQAKRGIIKIFLHDCQKLVSIGIFPLILMQILWKPFEKHLFPHQKHQLLDRSCSFSIWDRIKYSWTSISVRHCWYYGMRVFIIDQHCWALLVKETLERTLVRKCFKVRRFAEEEEGKKCGYPLMEPSIVPPAHRDQVTDPVMR